MLVRHRALLALAALALAGGTTWALVSGSARNTPGAAVKLPLTIGGVRVSEVAPSFHSSRKAVGAGPRDWLIETKELKLVFGANSASPEGRARLGALLDLGTKSLEEDELREMRTVLAVAGKSVSLRVAEVTVSQEGNTPVVRVRQLSHDGRLELETDYMVLPGHASGAISTQVLNVTDQLMRSVQVGDRALWPGVSTFAPRAGLVRVASRAEVPWVARDSQRLSYVLSFGGATFEASFLFDLIGALGQTTLSPPRDLSPGATFEVERELIVGRGGLDVVGESAWKSVGKRVGWVKGTLSPPPSWGIVEARYPDNKPALLVRADSEGRYQLPLPEGDYRLLLRSPGGEDQEDVSVEADAPAYEANLLPPRPGTLRFSIVDEQDVESPARLVVRGVGATKDPDFGPVQTAVGAGNVVYTKSGSGFAELPAGRYHVVTSHGDEFSVDEQDVQIAEDEGAALHVVLKRELDTTGFLACDFHVHAEPSHDSEVKLDDRVTSLVGEGIEFVAATDHDHVTDYTPIIERLAATTLVRSTTGVEITTSSWGHFNAFPYPLLAAPPEHVGRDPAQIFATVRARAPGAVIQVNHPRMPGVGYFNRIELDPATGSASSEDFSFEFDSIEVANGYDLENPKMLDDNLKEFFGLLNSGRRFTVVGNSDSHRLIGNWVGHPRTYVRVPDERLEAVDAAEIARQLLAGHVSVGNGIFLLVVANGTAQPGDLLSEKRVTLQISARAPAWSNIRRIEVFANGALAATREVHAARGSAPARIDWQTDLDLSGDTWLMVVARGTEPLSKTFGNRRVLPFAFANPIFVDADQDGVFHAINDIPPVPAPDTSARPE